MNESTKHGKYEISIELLQQAKVIYEEEGEVSKLAKVWCILAHCFSSLHKYRVAIEHFQYASILYEEGGNRNLLGSARFYLGVCYKSLEQYDNAIKMLEL